MRNPPVTPALVLLVADIAVGVACVLLPPLVMGFLALLKDIFGVLILPFSFLFGLAGWSSDMSSLETMQGGLVPDMMAHPFRAASAAALLVVGGACSLMACGTPDGARMERNLAPVFTFAAMVLVGVDPGLIVLPAFVLQLLALRYPAMDFLKIRR
ncbi:hypothetical protein [Acetobacter pasteurianus]|uniref:Uncharacterized protein n=1 Tax=Acetobacter pasteurianus NBRC 3188 TaxID=1226663 RepID=A0A401WRG9_ACEPA|nr:hypothetical protein [Acetobacter pasteurianus]QHM90874.1 hypothetical protein FCN51_04525 [Acetobacter pasteurianus]GCD51913.1 hypothetical protein NBRC3188_0610 [Acetobacter pasteurianus NBRC 3188]GCD55380.1 hypothetical protein NBRC3222_0717 [Acetobacter pasteurianus NBRC 3222]